MANSKRRKPSYRASISGTVRTPRSAQANADIQSRCEASAFSTNDKDTDDPKAPVAYHQLYRMIEDYFLSGTADPSRKVCRTSLPPLYFQHPGNPHLPPPLSHPPNSHLPGHSLTIIGFEKRKSGTCNLLVLDPMFKPSPGILQLIGTRFRAMAPEKLLKAYRRGETYLGKHSCFEVLQ